MTPTRPCTCHAGHAAKNQESPVRLSNHARHQNASLRTSVQLVPVTAAVIRAHQVGPPLHAHEPDQRAVPDQGSKHTHATLSLAQQVQRKLPRHHSCHMSVESGSPGKTGWIPPDVDSLQQMRVLVRGLLQSPYWRWSRRSGDDPVSVRWTAGEKRLREQGLHQRAKSPAEHRAQSDVRHFSCR